MNRYNRAGNVLCLLIAIVAAFLLLTAVPQKAEAADLDRYGYKKLENDKQRQAYGLIADALVSGAAEVSLSQVGISQDDFVKAIDLVCNDYPEIIGLNGYSYVCQGNQVASAQFTYTMSGQNFQSAIAALNGKVNEIISGVPSGSDYKKALYLHDYIVDNVEYQNSANDQNAYGALVEGKAVCAGYARAYQLLLHKVGIDSFYVTGTSRGISHAWLLVFLDGECYYTDVTWDDAKSVDGKPLKGHYYFNMSYDDIAADHIVDAKYSQWLPSHHSHMKLYYFEQEKKEGSGIAWFNSNSAPETLFNYLKKDGNTYTCDFRFDGDDVNAWLNSAFQSMTDKLTNIQPVCQGIGHEYLLSFTAEPRQHTAGNWKTDAAKHWKECTSCNSVIDGTTAAHGDSNGDYSCDTCGYKLPGGSSTTQNSTSSGSAASTPSNGTSTPSTGNGTPSNSATSPSTGASTPSTEGNTSSTDSTQGTTPSLSVPDTLPPDGQTDGTTPSADAAQDASAPTQGDQNIQSEEGNGTGDRTWIIIVSAVVVLGGAGAAAFVVIRKKRIS